MREVLIFTGYRNLLKVKVFSTAVTVQQHVEARIDLAGSIADAELYYGITKIEEIEKFLYVILSDFDSKLYVHDYPNLTAEQVDQLNANISGLVAVENQELIKKSKEAIVVIRKLLR